MADEELLREERFPLVLVQTAIANKIIEKYCSAEKIISVLDAGAGTGRYSIPIAKSGYKVCHLDISQEMIEHAHQIARREGLENIEFKLGSIENLSYLKNESFDMSLSFDAPVSYSYPNHEKAICELCRVTENLLFLMVSNRNGVIPFMVDFDLSRDYLPPNYNKEIAPFYATQSTIENGVEKWPADIQEYLNKTGSAAPLDYSFGTDELKNLLNKEGFGVLEIAGPGALARNIRPENLDKITSDKKLFKHFIELSMDFDFHPNNIGLGAVNLLVVAKRKKRLSKLSSICSQALSGKVIKLIQSNLESGEVGFEDIAKQLKMPQHQITKQLKIEGVSFSHLLEYVRKELAREFLKKKEFNVSEIAYQLGYSAPSCFNRAFKKWFGKSPGSFTL